MIFYTILQNTINNRYSIVGELYLTNYSDDYRDIEELLLDIYNKTIVYKIGYSLISIMTNKTILDEHKSLEFLINKYIKNKIEEFLWFMHCVNISLLIKNLF